MQNHNLLCFDLHNVSYEITNRMIYVLYMESKCTNRMICVLNIGGSAHDQISCPFGAIPATLCAVPSFALFVDALLYMSQDLDRTI
jgi:hypothetical protein